MIREIKDWRDGRVIWSGEAETVKDALHAAIASKANLSGAHLSGANLSNLTLCPTVFLLSNLGVLSDALMSDLMNYDASNHPNGKKAFTAWAKGGACPYSGVNVYRVAQFQERRDCWKPRRKLLTAYELMVRVIREIAKDSDYHDKGKK